MDLTQGFINQEVRRIVFSLKKPSGEYVHIFSILEKIDEDMQDYNDFAPNYGNEFNDFVPGADGKDNKLYLTVDRITITKDLFEKPWDSYYSGKTGTHERLVEMMKLAKRKLPVKYNINIVQPGVSKAKASDEILSLLGVTESYLLDRTGIKLKVIVNEDEV